MLEEEREMAASAATNPTDMEHPITQEDGAKYETHAHRIDASVLGDNVGVVNNYHYNNPSLQDMAQLLSMLGLTATNRDSSLYTAAQKDMWERFGEELQDVATANEEREYVPGQMDAAAMPPEIDEWFYALDEYERYYVVSAALLQGASATDVSLQARELYQTCRSSHVVTHQSMDGAIPSHSATRLKKRTYTFINQSGGVPRLFWQNAAFGAQVLRFIAEESLAWPGSQPGQSFLDMLQKWPEELAGECARRSARALGGIFVYQSTNQLWRVANAWANADDDHHWHIAALLLSGAYEVGSAETDQKMSHAITDSVLRLLQQWAERFAQTSNTRVACAAARTYSLLGKEAPEIALQGIGQLLQQPIKKMQNIPPTKFISSLASAYVALAWSGHIRLVLDTLATYTEQWSHQHYLPTKEYQRYRQQREIVLNVTFDAFFLIAASSFAPKNTASSHYSTTEFSPEHPTLLDSSGRDILLAGILMCSEPQWHLSVSMLLCSAILEKRSKSAFDLLHQWAEIISDQSSDTAGTLRAAFVRFMVNLAQKLCEWCHDLETRGLTRRAVETYKEKLALWKNEEVTSQKAIRMLAQEILLLIG
jgi:hypothetical protein